MMDTFFLPQQNQDIHNRIELRPEQVPDGIRGLGTRHVGPQETRTVWWKSEKAGRRKAGISTELDGESVSGSYSHLDEIRIPCIATDVQVVVAKLLSRRLSKDVTC